MQEIIFYITLFGILFVAILYGYIRYAKKLKNKELNQKIERLKKNLPLDNVLLKGKYSIDDFIKNNFRLKTIGKRLVAYGEIEGKLVLIKVKERVFYIGILTPFNTREPYFDICLDLSSLKGGTEGPHFYGTENNYFYVKMDENWSASIKDHIDEIIRILEKANPKYKVQLGSTVTDITTYETNILSLKELYN